MPDITEPVQVEVGKPVKASDHNTSADAITELTAALGTLENSQLIDGSFENGLASWVATDIGAGSHIIEETVVIHGVKSFKATATAGGGYVELDSDDFLNISAEIDDVFIDGRIRVTAQLRVQGWIEWFDKDDVSISTQQFMDYTFGGGELDAWVRFRGWGRAVATARSYKLIFQLGDGTVAGSVYLDGITSRLNSPYPWVMLDVGISFGSFTVPGDTIKVPVIGSAYTVWTYFSGATTDFMYNVDTGNFVSMGGSRSLSNTATNLVTIDGIKCDESGQVRAAGQGGAETGSFNMWR